MPDFKRAFLDGGATGVGAGAGEDLRAGADFENAGHVVNAVGDHAGEGAVVVGIAEGDRCRGAGIRFIADHDTASAESPHLEGARRAAPEIEIVGPAQATAVVPEFHGAVELNVRVLQPRGVAEDADAAAGADGRAGDAVDDQGAGEGGVVVAQVHPGAGVGRIDRHRGGRVRSGAFESIVQVESCSARITLVIDGDTGPGIDRGATPPSVENNEVAGAEVLQGRAVLQEN